MAKKHDPKAAREKRLAEARIELSALGNFITDKHGHDLSGRLQEAILEYHGDLTVLESALGAVIIAKTMGWQVLRLIHSTKTYAKYERLLSSGLPDGERFRFADHFEPRNGQSDRSYAIKISDTIQSFWKVARGEVGVPEGQKMIESV